MRKIKLVNKETEIVEVEKKESIILNQLLEKTSLIDFYAETNESHISDRFQFSKFDLRAMPILSFDPDGRCNEEREMRYNENMRIWKRENIKALEYLRYLHETKISHLQYMSASIQKVIEQIKSQNIILCDSKDSVFLYNGKWEEAGKDVFADFLVRAAEKMGAPALDKKEMLKLFLDRSRLQFLDENSEVTKVIRVRIENQ